MKLDTLSSVLAEQKHIRREGNSYLVDEGLIATLFWGTGGEVLSISRIVRIELSKECCSFATVKGERYFVPADYVLALKLEQGEPSPKSATGAGFR